LYPLSFTIASLYLALRKTANLNTTHHSRQQLATTHPLVLCACVILRKKAGWSRKVESLRPCVIATVLILQL
jgi:hypothetical protein